MKKANPIDFGNRVRDLRIARGFSQAKLAAIAGYSQTNIGWIEQGKAKKPHVQVIALAEALRTTQEWLLWGTGRRDVGPLILSPDEIVKNYETMNVEQRAAATEFFLQLIENADETRKIV